VCFLICPYQKLYSVRQGPKVSEFLDVQEWRR
jgi:hypothetical protein